jgi:8-oxo-dGTP pyrophosphatase MutT (NUDIX family)
MPRAAAAKRLGMTEIRKGKTISAGGVVINRHGEVLIVNQRGNSWSLPKGHVDPGEDLLTAARRETFEEAGVDDLELICELGGYERARIGKHGGEDASELKTLHFFLFTTSQMNLAPKDPDHPEARWVTLEDAVPMLTHPRDGAFLDGMIPLIREKLNDA